MNGKKRTPGNLRIVDQLPREDVTEGFLTRDTGHRPILSFAPIGMEACPVTGETLRCLRASSDATRRGIHRAKGCMAHCPGINGPTGHEIAEGVLVDNPLSGIAPGDVLRYIQELTTRTATPPPQPVIDVPVEVVPDPIRDIREPGDADCFSVCRRSRGELRRPDCEGVPGPQRE